MESPACYGYYFIWKWGEAFPYYSNGTVFIKKYFEFFVAWHCMVKFEDRPSECLECIISNRISDISANNGCQRTDKGKNESPVPRREDHRHEKYVRGERKHGV